MSITLKNLNIGKVDGKHEYLTPRNDRDRHFFDAYLIPQSVEPARFSNDDIFLIEGFRGTGKTSLLRWFAEECRKAGAYTDFILFKSDLTEQQRLQISTEVGISWVDIDAKRMEVSQDFKTAWKWFIHHKIGETIKKEPGLAIGSKLETYLKLLGLQDPTVFSKVIGFLPKLEGAHVTVKADASFFQAELGGDFKPNGSTGKTTLDALARRLDTIFVDLTFVKPLYLFFDELEVFFHSLEQYHRDQRMVRDLIFSVAAINDLCRRADSSVHILAAVRSEVVDGMGPLGQEVDRLIHDKGFNLAWYMARRSLHHPLVEVIRRKIDSSKRALGVQATANSIEEFFPQNINGQTIDAFLLDRSFYKPRDLVWRLSIAQKQYPEATKFSIDVLTETEVDYSAKMWDEIKYELSASYSTSDIDVIEMVIAGSSSAFQLDDIDRRFETLARESSNAQKLLSRRSAKEILSDLYRLGAIGNVFRAGTTADKVRNRWAFRGDPNLLLDKRMTIHPSLYKRLSAIAPRRRGKR
ncbi:hypothetical protein RAD16_31170 [Bradyrhizobium sp. 18BD]